MENDEGSAGAPADEALRIKRWGFAYGENHELDTPPCNMSFDHVVRCFTWEFGRDPSQLSLWFDGHRLERSSKYYGVVRASADTLEAEWRASRPIPAAADLPPPDPQRRQRWVGRTLRHFRDDAKTPAELWRGLGEILFEGGARQVLDALPPEDQSLLRQLYLERPEALKVLGLHPIRAEITNWCSVT